QGLAYVERLRAEGVRVEHLNAEGTIHGHINLRQAIPSAQADVENNISILKSMLAQMSAET
ncbi:MAG: hypothetical protein WBO17_00215, partial [Sphingorhabdus sp.]